MALIHRNSGEIYATDYGQVHQTELKKVNRLNGWNGFDWASYLKNENCFLYKLRVKGDPSIQGLICMEPMEGWVEVRLAESAPWNIGSKEQFFVGVGSHLFALACRKSFELGFEGFVAFHAKSQLIGYYQKTFGAMVIDRRTRRMVINTAHADILVQTYFD
ncbi:MAG TPA: hypothetical protein VFK44_03260 [Bacillales bacterium]|nr:hypothetical protein [Bacillales bacterium]